MRSFRGRYCLIDLRRPIRRWYINAAVIYWAHIIRHNALVYSGDFDRKELQSLVFFRFGLPRRWKDKKKWSEEQFKALFHFLNRWDTFVCLATANEKTLIYHTAVLVARKVKILPSNSLVVVVSPLNALKKWSGSCSTTTIHWRSSKMPKCFTAVQKPWKTSDPRSSF